MIERERVQALNGARVARGRYVLYWMQASQRADFNPALEHAIAHAAELKLPVVVGFGLTDDYPEANARHYSFLLEGLADVKAELAERGIKLVARRGAPDEVALGLSRDAALVVCDRGYLRHQKQWRRHLADVAPVRVEQVEGDVVVPVGVVSQKQEYAARTIRPKLSRELARFLKPLSRATVDRDSRCLRLASDFDPGRPRQVLEGLRVDSAISPVRRLRGGTAEARRHLEEFITSRLAGYGSSRNELADFYVSHLGPYLHFGHVSPVQIALAVNDARAAAADRGAFIEQLVVRRELSINYVHHEPRYDRYAGVPSWARETLAEHARDPRPYRYSHRELVAARTHDPHFNAAMREMVHTGYMHNYMRMYWAKKILEWSRSPEEAFANAVALNDKWFLDGRDPNGYTGVAWAIGGKHDRPWPERPIFGKIRYMSYASTSKKFDCAGYIRRVEQLERD